MDIAHCWARLPLIYLVGADLECGPRLGELTQYFAPSLNLRSLKSDNSLTRAFMLGLGAQGTLTHASLAWMIS
jgi:hypothetical protein